MDELPDHDRRLCALVEDVFADNKVGFMFQSALVRAAAISLGCGLVCGLASAQLIDAQIPKDRTEGSWLNFDPGQLYPMSFSPTGNLLFVVNQPAARVAFLDPDTLAVLAELRTGPGLVSLVSRRGSSEVWAVDRVTGAVSVIDHTLPNIVRTIRTSAEPHGLVFAAGRAYVTCAGANAVDVIDLRSGSPTAYEVVQTIPIPAEDPRGIAVLGEHAYLVPLLSGNNTAPSLVNPGGDLDELNALVGDVAADSMATPLPDRDLLRILISADPALDTLDTGFTVSGLGTVLLNLHKRPGTSELWVPNTESLNALVKGEKNFIDGKVVSNRISIHNVSSGATQIVDLDPLAPSGLGCAQPSSVAFDEDSGRAYVACYGSDLVVVLDLATKAWLGHYEIPALLPGGRSGPRGLVFDARRDRLYVYCKADGAVAWIDTVGTSLAGGQPNQLESVGYDPTPLDVKRGRGHIINAQHSGGLGTSCASCHIDGDTDMGLWDLSQFLDPEGTPTAQLAFGKDVKGPMVTQSLRGLRETLPYHWRGEQKTLEAFNAAFVGLLDNEAELTPSEFADLKAYVESLVYPTNPRSDSSGEYVGRELFGADLFGAATLASCANCHTPPLGTSNDPMRVFGHGPSTSFVPAQLRGLGDKVAAPVFTAGSTFGDTNDLGVGFLHNGTSETLGVFLDRFFALPAQDRADLEDFLQAFDTGLKPASAFQSTVNTDNVPAVGGTFADFEYLKQQALAGNCDVAVYGQVRNGAPIYVKGWHLAGTNGFFGDFGGVFQAGAMFDLVRAGVAEFTFVGLPLGMGYRFGVDQDMDLLLDTLEAAHGTSPTLDDEDGDGFPDGSEVAWGTDPMDPADPPAGASLPDSIPPGFLEQPVFLVATTNVLKLRFVTDELARATIKVTWTDAGGQGHELSFVGPTTTQWGAWHSMVLPDLPRGELFNLELTLVDPAGNTSVQNLSSPTFPGVPDCFVDDIAISTQLAFTIQQPSGLSFVGGTGSAVMSLVDQSGGDAAFVVAAIYLEVDGVLQMIDPLAFGTVSAETATIGFNLPTTPTSATHVIYVIVNELLAADGSLAGSYAEGLDNENCESLTY